MHLAQPCHIAERDQPMLGVAGACAWRGFGYWYWFSAGAPGGLAETA